MEPRVAGWVRLGIIVTLAVPQLAIGLWSTLAPRSWFDQFPGFGPALVAAEPPYNRHLVSDAGAGFLATGVALLVAALWASRSSVRLALLTYVAFTVPHVAFHAFNPSEGLTAVEDVVNTGSLASGLVLAAVFAYWSGDRSPVARAAASST